MRHKACYNTRANMKSIRGALARQITAWPLDYPGRHTWRVEIKSTTGDDFAEYFLTESEARTYLIREHLIFMGAPVRGAWYDGQELRRIESDWKYHVTYISLKLAHYASSPVDGQVTINADDEYAADHLLLSADKEEYIVQGKNNPDNFHEMSKRFAKQKMDGTFDEGKAILYLTGKVDGYLRRVDPRGEYFVRGRFGLAARLDFGRQLLEHLEESIDEAIKGMKA